MYGSECGKTINKYNETGVTFPWKQPDNPSKKE